MLMLENQADRSFPNFRGISFAFLHVQILSKNLAFDKPGAIQ